MVESPRAVRRRRSIFTCTASGRSGVSQYLETRDGLWELAIGALALIDPYVDPAGIPGLFDLAGWPCLFVGTRRIYGSEATLLEQLMSKKSPTK